MKIKQVCELTGLTERTVRFYVEESLLSPQTTRKNGREYREYSETDVSELKTIAELRRLFFSIEDIKRMKASPGRIGEVVKEYRSRIQADAEAKAAIVERLDTVNVEQLSGMGELARRLNDLSADLPLPRQDVQPAFGRFDGISEQEREAEYQRYLERQAKEFRMGRIIVIVIAGINMLFAILSLIGNHNVFTFVIQMALSIALFAGVVWVRYLFVFGLFMGILQGISLLASASTAQGVPGWVYGVILFQLVFSGAAGWLLLRSSAVSEFLYAQKNG
ncbi:MerR family transcriptional regulator [Gorillibacterium sp. sgz500922]|uniref:MerR family transcriptional regulator n=1 Tax=Gorillibacterium sp. sgz500922 TaxID=3446694 RepID=UPI003F67ACFB